MKRLALLLFLFFPIAAFADGFQSTEPASSGTAVDTVGAFGSSPDAKGASLSGTTLTMQPADATHPGEVTTGAQTFAGAKSVDSTFTSTVAAGNSFKVTGGSKYCLNAACTSYVYDDGFGSAYVVGASDIHLNSSGTNAAAVTGPVKASTLLQNQLTMSGSSSSAATTLTASGGDTDIDITLTTKGAGVTNSPGFHATASTSVGTITISASTSGTATVRSGCKPICTNTTSTTAVKCAVSSTTLTATEAGSSSDAINYFCF